MALRTVKSLEAAAQPHFLLTFRVCCSPSLVSVYNSQLPCCFLCIPDAAALLIERAEQIQQMAGPSLAELKKRQLLRRQQQKQKGGQKRKREASSVPLASAGGGYPRSASAGPTAAMGSSHRSEGRLETYFKRSASAKPLPDTVGTATRTTAAVAVAAMLSRSGSLNGPFAAVPRETKQNPFDIISDLVAGSMDASSLDGTDQSVVYQESGEQLVIVGASGHISDSDDEVQGKVDAFGDDGTDRWSEHQHEYDLGENDPSLYKITPTTDTGGNISHSNENALGMLEIADDNECTEPTTNAASTLVARQVFPVEYSKSSNTPAEAASVGDNTGISGGSSFSKPLESLSLRSHVSITSAVPLKQLERLKDDGSFLSFTSLCGRRSSPLNCLADALLHYEIAGSGSDTAARPNTQPRDSRSGNGAAHFSHSVSPTAAISHSAGASIGQMQQAFMSLFRLQMEAPALYPFIYLVARDYTVVFKIIHSAEPKEEGGSSGSRRVAIISQSSLGLRKTLRAEGVDFSVPLAPKTRNWSEIPGAIEADEQEKWHLQSTAFDKTWQSALLVVDTVNINGPFSHLYSTPLDAARIYSTGPFLNATMRRATLRFSNAVTYENGAQGGEKTTRRLFKLDIKGVVFPSYWSTILAAVAELFGDTGFYAVSKETPDTAHFALLASKQSGAMASKKSVSYADGQYTYM
ncbi:hypothetical protein GQ54DRAFT_325363 [Martensiomyces pterosporus]|nr:hypothetical protein GQ54DRAFT_325363 [Martensiomyces pterosporus]